VGYKNDTGWAIPACVAHISDSVRVVFVLEKACLGRISMKHRDDSCGAYQSAWRTLATLYALYLFSEKPICEKFQCDVRTTTVGPIPVCVAHIGDSVCMITCFQKRLSGRDSNGQ
jgi:hypothetical protein